MNNATEQTELFSETVERSNAESADIGQETGVELSAWCKFGENYVCFRLLLMQMMLETQMA